MKIAIPNWRGRISPVFDVCTNLLLVDVAESKEQARELIAINGPHPQDRTKLLTQHGVDVLICCAISKPVELAVVAAGIEVVPQTCGEIEQVLASFIGGQLGQSEFLMPGCFRRHRHRRTRCRRRARSQEQTQLNQENHHAK